MRLLYLALLALTCSCAQQENENQNSGLVGTYELISWQGEKPDGSIVYPYGTDAKGIIMYDSNGNMSMQLEKNNRSLLGTDNYDELDSATVLHAYQGFFSYYGAYVVDESTQVITHVIEGCKNPDWYNRSLNRKYQLSHDTLVLKSDSVIGMDHTLLWKRR